MNKLTFKPDSDNGLTAHQGNALSEYGLILALIALLGIGSLQFLGGSLSGLFNNTGNELKSGRMSKLVSMDFSDAAGQNGGNRMAGTLGTDPSTGLPGMGLADTGGSGTNTTSTDGMTAKTAALSSFDIAKDFSNLANETTSEPYRSYLKEMSDLAYWMGGAEGHLAGIQGLVINPDSTSGNTTYTETNAHIDLYNYELRFQELAAKMQSAPPELRAQVAPMIADVEKQAEPYVSKLEESLEDIGVPTNKPLDLDAYMQTGAARKEVNKMAEEFMEDAYNIETKQNMTSESYNELIENPLEFKATVENVVSSGSASGTASGSTLQDALNLDDAAVGSLVGTYGAISLSPTASAGRTNLTGGRPTTSSVKPAKIKPTTVKAQAIAR